MPTDETRVAAKGYSKADLERHTMTPAKQRAAMVLYETDVPERLREIAESIVDATTEEGRFLLKAADEFERLHRIGARWKHNSEEWERLARAEGKSNA